MKEKTEKLVITFPTTTMAMKMDSLSTPDQGRLIPLPGEISAGCGLSWSTDPTQEEDLLKFMEENSIEWEGTFHVALY